MYGSGTLKVTTTFMGSAAEEQRDNFNNQSISELVTTCQKFYSTYYPDIKGDSITYTDNDSTGIFTTTEYYTIPKFWTADEDKGNKFSFYPFMIDYILRRPKEKDRKMPFRLVFPAKYQEEVIVDLPQDWKVTEDETHLKNANYSYNSKFYCIDNHVYLKADYENYKDYVSADEATTYFKDLREYDKGASIELSLEDAGAKKNKSGTGGKNILSTIIFLGVVAGGMVWWNKKA
jgi:hypothetical protein